MCVSLSVVRNTVCCACVGLRVCMAVERGTARVVLVACFRGKLVFVVGSASVVFVLSLCSLS